MLRRYRSNSPLSRAHDHPDRYRQPDEIDGRASSRRKQSSTADRAAVSAFSIQRLHSFDFFGFRGNRDRHDISRPDAAEQFACGVGDDGVDHAAAIHFLHEPGDLVVRRVEQDVLRSPAPRSHRRAGSRSDLRASSSSASGSRGRKAPCSRRRPPRRGRSRRNTAPPTCGPPGSRPRAGRPGRCSCRCSARRRSRS